MMKPQPEAREELFWPHFVRAFSIAAVVIIHVGADFLHGFGQVPMGNWWAANAYVSFARVSVPLFFMISGMLLLGRNETLGELFGKRVLKILLPLCFWSVFYLLLRLWLFSPPIDFGHEIRNLILTPAFPHLWFLYAMLAVYLAYPILRPFIQFASPQAHWYYIGIWLLVLIVMPNLQIRAGIGFNQDFVKNLGLFTGYLGYPVLGYLLGKSPRNNYLIAAMIPIAVISPIFTMIRTYSYSLSTGDLDTAAQYYLGPTVILSAISTFYLLRFTGEYYQEKLWPIFRTTIVALSQESYGIYLVHMAFIILLTSGKFQIRLIALANQPLWAIPLATIITLAFSYLFVVLVKKLPLGKWFLP